MTIKIKSIKQFILENQSEIFAIIKRIMANCDYSKLKEYKGEQDPDRFDIQKENELALIDGIDEGKLRLIGTEEYYNLNNDKKFENLSSKEKAEFDTKNGDIIIVDENNKAKYFIDVKISDKYLGAISLGSLANFNEDGYYLLICKTGKLFKVISHKDVLKALEDGKLELNPPTHKYVGYDVEWNGEKLTSEYFIKGSALRKLD